MVWGAPEQPASDGGAGTVVRGRLDDGMGARATWPREEPPQFRRSGAGSEQRLCRREQPGREKRRRTSGPLAFPLRSPDLCRRAAAWCPATLFAAMSRRWCAATLFSATRPCPVRHHLHCDLLL
ncbi:hypothetical protein SESBI_19946 [Sesbania bispinosa]|nr:hypothetical protein SESBI_19946 [Sesbania bispinosa]